MVVLSRKCQSEDTSFPGTLGDFLEGIAIVILFFFYQPDSADNNYCFPSLFFQCSDRECTTRTSTTTTTIDQPTISNSKWYSNKKSYEPGGSFQITDTPRVDN